MVPPDWREQGVTNFWVKQQYGEAIAVTGTTVTGTVRIQSPAPVGGLAVDIRNDPTWNGTAYSAAYVVVPAGATSATFFPVGVDRSVPIGTKVKITATWVLGPSPVTTEITIQD